MTVSQLHAALLPTERLKDRFATDAAAAGRDPLALSYGYSSISQPDEETGEAPPLGYVRGGTGSFSRILGEVAEALGVRIHLGQEVTQFLVESDRVVGIRLADGTEVRSRVVLSNLDPKRTFPRLFEPQHLDPAFRRRIEGLVTEVSCYKLLAAISELPCWRSWDGDPLPSWMPSCPFRRSSARAGRGILIHRLGSAKWLMTCSCRFAQRARSTLGWYCRPTATCMP